MVKATKLLYLLLFLLTPWIFTTFNSELFEVPKMYLVYFFTLLVLCCHVINYFKGQISLVSKNPLNLPLLLFLLSQIITTIISVDVHTSFFGYYSRLNGGLLSLLAFSLLFFILTNYLDDKFKQDIITISLLSGLIVASYGVLEHFGIDTGYWQQDVRSRVFSTLGQPNWLSAYLCILLPLALSQKSKKYQLLSIILFLCLLFTKSKSGLIAAIVSIGVYYLISFLKKNLRITDYLLPITFIILSLTISNPVKDLVFPSKMINGSIVNGSINITPSQDIRKIVWSGAIKLWQKYPIFGTGPETFAYTYYSVRPAAHNLTSEWEFLYNKVHNEYLNYLANTGAVGLFFYLLLIFSSIYLFISRRRWELLAAYLSILITNFAGFSVVVVSLFFFLLPALALKPTPMFFPRFFRFPILLLTTYLLICLSTHLFNYYLADVALAQGDNQDQHDQYVTAYQYFIKSYQLNPYEPTYLSRLSVLSAKLAAAYSLQKDTSLATEFTTNSLIFSDQALQISPLNINFWKERTQSLLYLTTVDPKYYDLAIDTLHQTATLAPTDAKTFYLLAKIYSATDHPTDAETSYLRAIDLKSNYDLAYFDLGLLYFNQKKYDLAKKYFELNLQYSPNNPNALEYLKKIK